MKTAQKGMYTESVLVTPELAKQWLEESEGVNPRPVSQALVNYLVEEIKAGRWMESPEGLAFNTERKCIDGQHRLWAVVESGIAVRMRVTWNTPDPVKEVMNSGCIRSLAIRSGQESQVTAVYTFMIGALQTKTKTHTFQVRTLDEKFGHHIHALLNECPSQAKKFSAAVVRTAAVMAMHHGQRPSYVLKVYRDLVLQHTEALNKCALHFWTQTIALDGKGDVRDRYARAYYAFTEANEMNKVQINESYKDRVWQALRDDVRTALNGHAKGA